MVPKRQPDSSTATGLSHHGLDLPPEARERGGPTLPRAAFAAGRTALAILLMVNIVFTADGLSLNLAQRTAAPHLYSLVQWEASNFLDKWLHWTGSVLPWNSVSEAEREEMIGDYFALSAARADIEARLKGAVAGGSQAGDKGILEAQLAALDRSRSRIRPEVEETLESAISSVISAEGLPALGGLIFPPVDFRLTQTPRLLVTSPRDRIERGDEALLRSGVTLTESLALERALLDEHNVSALVVPIGGLASYPASVYDDAGLRWTLQIAAHEWLHHFLFFRPLGFWMMSSAEMQTINETVANVAGREMGDLAFARLGGELGDPEHLALPMAHATDPHSVDGGVFDFRNEMRSTRLHVDELLAEGRIEAAEAYMERRRQAFVQRGYDIRRLNQAYFAFYGTYADSAASASPIGDQVIEYRNLSPSLGAFILRIASIGSHAEFLADLDALRAAAH